MIGVPDEQWGETVKAIVLLRQGATATEEEIIDFCRGKLGGFERPRSVDFIEQLPRNPSGKVSSVICESHTGLVVVAVSPGPSCGRPFRRSGRMCGLPFRDRQGIGGIAAISKWRLSGAPNRPISKSPPEP